MSSWLILVDSPNDFSNADTPHKVMTTREYLKRPHLFRESRPQIINLARSYAYQGRGYYCSLLAEARGHRVIPRVETILELASKELYAASLPDLEEALNKALANGARLPEGTNSLLVCFGGLEPPGLETFGRLLFDWFRAPILEVRIQPGEWTRIARIRALGPRDIPQDVVAFFRASLEKHSRSAWRESKPRDTARYSVAVLHDPSETLPPSNTATLKHLTRIASRMDVEIVPITRRDLARLAENDALFIRETTALTNHTYRFARRAMQEGMPVIDDPMSMIRCTNKIYLAERLAAAGLPMPRTVVIGSLEDLAAAEAVCGYPLVVKIPDGSFSRGVRKLDDAASAKLAIAEMLKDTDLVVAQEFMPTDFDWRIGVLDGEPLYACQYLMARKHWQIIKHRRDKSPIEGGVKAIRITDAPAAVIEVAAQAGQLIGSGLYGVDLKQNENGVFVIEINDNPNIDHSCEDQAEGEIVWQRLMKWFITRIDER